MSSANCRNFTLPKATNIQSLVVDLTEKLGNVPSQQSTDFGYIGMIERADIHALT